MAEVQPNLPEFQVDGEFWSAQADGRIRCDLCPRHCKLQEGARGLCFVRQRLDDKIVLNSYGRSSGFCIDPIEKKPLSHFLPGTAVLSLGTAGCNLGCTFCQNHDISKSRQMDTLQSAAYPEAIAQAAEHLSCASVAYTYNDPIIFYEYAYDTAIACHGVGVRNVAVTAGYITKQARPAFFRHMDAANVDLKAFSERFYKKITKSSLQTVLDTLMFLVHETQVWVEITNLIIPGENDSNDEIRAMCDWIVDNLRPDVPVHFSAFHPDYRMLDKPRTPKTSLVAARQIGKSSGLRHVYIGNTLDVGRQSTYCPNCHTRLIERVGYTISNYQLTQSGDCYQCGTKIAGCFVQGVGDWGARRQAVDMRSYAITPEKSARLQARKSSSAPRAA